MSYEALPEAVAWIGHRRRVKLDKGFDNKGSLVLVMANWVSLRDWDKGSFVLWGRR